MSESEKSPPRGALAVSREAYSMVADALEAILDAGPFGPMEIEATLRREARAAIRRGDSRIREADYFVIGRENLP